MRIAFNYFRFSKFKVRIAKTTNDPKTELKSTKNLSPESNFKQ